MIAELKERHEHEISTLMSINASNSKQLREQYEERMREIEVLWVENIHKLDIN